MTDPTLPADFDALVTDAILLAMRYKLLYCAALDQLALVATQPERYEGMQRSLRQEREKFMTKELAR